MTEKSKYKKMKENLKNVSEKQEYMRLSNENSRNSYRFVTHAQI